MAMNYNGEVQCLEIDNESSVVPSEEIVYLGDIFNMWGNNDGLIDDRLKRGSKAIITIAALMAETDVGIHFVSTMLLLYRSLFLSTMLFNCQTWSKIRLKHIDKLRRMQLRFLKRTVGVGQYTTNSFIFLELGVLPIDFEIHRRQLMFLYRILKLDASDPVYKCFQSMRANDMAGEENWWSGIKVALEKYNIPTNLEEIKSFGKNAFRNLVNKSVTKVAFDNLVSECASHKKTAHLEYKSLQVQEYLLKLFPHQARTIIKCRSETVDVKS